MSGLQSQQYVIIHYSLFILQRQNDGESASQNESPIQRSAIINHKS